MRITREELEDELLTLMQDVDDPVVKVQVIALLAKLEGYLGPDNKKGALKTGVRICTDRTKADEKPFDPGQVIVDKTRIKEG